MTEPTGPNPFADEPVRSSAPAGPNPFADDPRAAPGPAPERTWWDTAKDVGQTADDAVRAAANAMTFGMADRFAGYMNSGGPHTLSSLVTGKGPKAYDEAVNEQVKLSEAARKRSPIASIAGDVGGAVALPGIGGRQLAARLAPDALALGSGLAARAGHAIKGAGARAAGYGTEGAVLGAAQGAGSTYTGKPIDYLSNAAWGGGIGGVLGAGMGAVFGPRGGMQSTAQRPTIPEQQRFTDLAYDRIRANPTQYETPAFGNTAKDLEMRLLQRFDPAGDSAPASFRAVQRMQDTNVVTPKSIEDIRQSLGDISPLARADRKAAREVRAALDDFTINPPPGAVSPANARSAANVSELQSIARASNAGLERSRTIANMRQSVENKTARQNSGLNAENVMRGHAEQMLNPMTPGSRARLAGYSPDEVGALRNILHPGPRAEALRYVGNFLGGGGGLGAAAATALGAGGYIYNSEDAKGGTLGGAAAAGAGLGLRLLANRGANQRMQALQDLVGQRNPLYQNRAARAPLAPPPGGAGVSNVRDALTTELVKQGYFQTDDGKLIPRITVNADYGQ
jgi:hypothetical protein